MPYQRRRGKPLQHLLPPFHLVHKKQLPQVLPPPLPVKHVHDKVTVRRVQSVLPLLHQQVPHLHLVQHNVVRLLKQGKPVHRRLMRHLQLLCVPRPVRRGHSLFRLFRRRQPKQKHLPRQLKGAAEGGPRVPKAALPPVQRHGDVVKLLLLLHKPDNKLVQKQRLPLNQRLNHYHRQLPGKVRAVAAHVRGRVVAVLLRQLDKLAKPARHLRHVVKKRKVCRRKRQPVLQKAVCPNVQLIVRQKKRRPPVHVQLRLSPVKRHRQPLLRPKPRPLLRNRLLTQFWP